MNKIHTILEILSANSPVRCGTHVQRDTRTLFVPRTDPNGKSFSIDEDQKLPEEWAFRAADSEVLHTLEGGLRTVNLYIKWEMTAPDALVHYDVVPLKFDPEKIPAKLPEKLAFQTTWLFEVVIWRCGDEVVQAARPIPVDKKLKGSEWYFEGFTLPEPLQNFGAWVNTKPSDEEMETQEGGEREFQRLLCLMKEYRPEAELTEPSFFQGFDLTA